MKPIVAIVGRPNVGKSRLFNRLTRSQRAIVYDYEGVTRDRQYSDAEWYGKWFTLIDTGGFVPESTEPILEQMRDQATLAIEEADIILFMMDCKDGFVNADQEIANFLRDTDKPVLYIVNKVDAWQKREELIGDFYRLGKDLFAISAEHGNGMDNLMDAAAEFLPKAEEDPPEDDGKIRIAVVGQPNAGKSSLVNAILGEERVLTSDIPGTTRDAIDLEFSVGDQEYLIIDTAGLRRKKYIADALEEQSIVQAIRSMDRADVAVFVIDVEKGVSWQDKKIANVVLNRGCACVVILNKWDLIEKDSQTAGEWVKNFWDEFPWMKPFPLLFISATTGQRVSKVLDKVHLAYESFTARVPTSDLNKFLEFTLDRHSPPTHRNRKLKFYYATQVATRPPTFALMVNHPDGVAPNYKRFLENQIRETYGFEGTPIRLLLRDRRREEREGKDKY